MGKKSFVVYDAWGHMVQSLPDDTAGKLFKALFAYRQTGNATLEDPALSGILRFMAGEIEKDNAKYEEMCERQRQRVLKRWEKEKDTAVYHGIPANTIKDKDKDKDFKKKNIKKKKANNCEPREYDFDDLERKLAGL